MAELQKRLEKEVATNKILTQKLVSVFQMTRKTRLSGNMSSRDESER